MDPALEEPSGGLRRRLSKEFAEPQHQSTLYLILNPIVGAATGLLFWLLFTRFAGLPVSELGVGYAIVALGTAIGLLAKGGLDTALLRWVPAASRPEAERLLRLGVLIGGAVALALAGGLAAASWAGAVFPDVALAGWAMVALISLLLVATWLQDAYFVAEGQAHLSTHRTLVFSGARLVLPLPIVALALPQPVPLAWGIGLAASFAAALFFLRRLPSRSGEVVSGGEFLQSALRNVSGGAAEFLPGLILVPIVLALEGAEAAAFFGIAWTVASLLFLASAAVCRSTLAQMVRNGPGAHAIALRRGILEHLWLVLPATAAVALLARPVLEVFGSDYARAGAPVLVVLCASLFLVAPAYLLLARLRATERSLALILLPGLTILGLAVLVPIFHVALGLPGVALAWLVANTPFGIYAIIELRRLTRGVITHGRTPALRRAPHLE